MMIVEIMFELEGMSPITRPFVNEVRTSVGSLKGLTDAITRTASDLETIRQLLAGTEVDEVGIVTSAVSQVSLLVKCTVLT
jgi:hypothetical protein